MEFHLINIALAPEEERREEQDRKKKNEHLVNNLSVVLRNSGDSKIVREFLEKEWEKKNMEELISNLYEFAKVGGRVTFVEREARRQKDENNRVNSIEFQNIYGFLMSEYNITFYSDSYKTPEGKILSEKIVGIHIEEKKHPEKSRDY